MPRLVQLRWPSLPCASGRAWRAALAAAAIVSSGALTGCAPDAWKPNPTYDAFLNKVDKNCGPMRIGEASISQLLNPGSNLYSAYFVDMTSRFETGRISADAYKEGIASTFTTILDTAGIRCIIAQKSP